MKFIGYAFLTLMSLGILGVIIGIGGFAWVINHYGNDIPDYNALKTYEPDIITRVYTGDGQLMAEFSTEKRIFVPIETIPDLVKQAFISAEDKNFYEHKGLDYLGIASAIFDKVKNPNSQLRGASTITQQVAKNFLLTNERSLERKLKEAILAIRMERALSKDRLLELYLNEIYLGIGTYGVASASQNYFNKSLDDLTIEEAAYLAALPKAPNNYHPTRKTERATNRRNWVIGRMEIDGFITSDEATIAKQTPLEVIDRSDMKKDVSAPYFAEEIRRGLQKEFGSDGLYREGMIVKSSINPTMQKMAEQALRDGLVAYDIRQGYRGAVATFSSFDDWQQKLADIPIQKGMLSDWLLALYFGDRDIRFADGSTGQLSQSGVTWAADKLKKGSVIMVTKDDEDETLYRIRQVPKVQGGLVVMDPHTGRVLAIQGGWDYERSEFNRATQAKRQPGSSFKPFIYLTALESGMTPATIVMDAPASFSQGRGMPLWTPKNYSGQYYGPTTLRVGIEKSRNIMTVRLADNVGMDAIADTARDFGIYPDMQKNLASSLGSNETTLMQMVSAYGMLVNGGKKIEPSFIDRIQNRYGQTVFKRDERQCFTCGPRIRWAENMPVPALDDNRAMVTEPQRAYQMVSILEGAIQRGTGVRLKNIGFPMAGKTGTTNDAKDAWFIGFTPNLVFGAYVGFDQPKSLGNKETGSSVALPIVKQFLENARDEGLIEPLPFRVPSDVSMIQVNAKTGRRAYPGDKNVIWEPFMNGETPDMQQTIYGGETVLFNEPNANYQQLFNPQAQSDIQYDEFGNPINMYGNDPFMNGFDPGDNDLQRQRQMPLLDGQPQSQPQIPQQSQPDPSLQGTGGIY